MNEIFEDWMKEETIRSEIFTFGAESKLSGIEKSQRSELKILIDQLYSLTSTKCVVQYNCCGKSLCFK